VAGDRRRTVADLLASMDAAGVDVSAVFAIATKPDQVEGIVRWCEAIRSARVAPFPSVHPAAPNCDKWIRRIAAGGFKGIKLHPMYQEFAIDEPRMDRLYGACRTRESSSHSTAGRTSAIRRRTAGVAARVANMLPRWPSLRVICSHMGGWREWDAAEEYLMDASNVWLDTSFSLEDMGAERAVKMIRRHGAGRWCSGTDCPGAARPTAWRSCTALASRTPKNRPSAAKTPRSCWNERGIDQGQV